MSSFAALNASELLVETEKAVGGEDMHARHESLISLRKTERELDRVSLFLFLPPNKLT